MIGAIGRMKRVEIPVTKPNALGGPAASSPNQGVGFSQHPCRRGTRPGV
jgi:hypothetical protein